MPVTKHRFSKCSHLGLGVECHRCQQADRMDAMAEGKIKPAKPGARAKKNPAWVSIYKTWTPEDFKREAARLRS